MRILFHAGFHKTGTSSLQRALMEHARMLAPLAHVETRKLSSGLSALAEEARAVSLDPSPARQEALARQLDIWLAGLPDLAGRALVVSSEDFSGHMPGRFGLADYGAAGRIMPILVAGFRRHFPLADICLLYTTRAADPWLRSLHWQLAKHPELTLKQRRFCKSFAGAGQFEAVLAPLEADLAGQARICRAALEDLAPRRLGPVEAVYDLLDLPEALRQALPEVPNANVAPPVGLADHFVTLNRAGLSAEALEQSKVDLALLMQAYPTEAE